MCLGGHIQAPEGPADGGLVVQRERTDKRAGREKKRERDWNRESERERQSDKRWCSSESFLGFWHGEAGLAPLSGPTETFASE